MGIDFSVRAKPFVAIPLENTANLFTVGGGADLTMDVDISSILHNPLGIGYAVGPEIGYKAAPLFRAESVASFFHGGLNASLFYLPFSRWSIRGEGALGLYQASFKGNTNTNTFWRFGGEVGFRITPNIIINLNGGYRIYNDKPQNPNYEGVYAGLTVQLSFETGRDDDGIQAELLQDEPIFPVFSGLYRTSPIGTLKITNNENAEIRNVRVSFQAGNYTASSFLCGTVSRLDKRRSAELSLLADFSPAIFNFSENSRFTGELVISYELLGAAREIRIETVVEVFNRNSFRWADPSALAVFVSPGSPEVQDYQKYLVGIARNQLRTGLNRNMQFAMFLYEGLRVAGLIDSRDMQDPYRELHKAPGRTDNIQFPFQTLAYRSGDVDDLGLLFSACLEAAGIRSALIPLDNDFVVAFSLGIDLDAAGGLFNSMDNLLVFGEEVWIPLALSKFHEGFINSWYEGINAINFTAMGGGEIATVILQEAWANYPPAAISSNEADAGKPTEQAVIRAVENSMQRYIVAELGPKIQAAFTEIQRLGATPARYNQLGLLYVRSGMFAEAKQVYRRSAALNNVAAMVNLGNIANVEKNTREAEYWYTEVLKLDPDNRTAVNALNQIALDRTE